MTTPSGIERGIVLADKEFDGGNVVGQLFGERQRFSHQTGGPLAQGAVEAFDGGGKATAFVAGDMLAGRNHQDAGFPKVRKSGGIVQIPKRALPFGSVPPFYTRVIELDWKRDE